MSVPTTQLAALASKKQGLSIESLAVPTPNDDELLVKITSTAINPIDWKLKDEPETYPFVKEWPTVLGCDAAGVVASVGKNVSTFQTGDRVLFQGALGDSVRSTFQQYTIVPSSLASKTPSNISDDQASTIPLGILTPAISLYSKSGANLSGPWSEGGNQVGKGQSIVILGGSTSIGQYAIQLARLSGFEKIITSASSSHKEFLSKLGGKNFVFLDRHSAEVKDYVEATEGLPLRTIFDSVSEEETQSLSVEILRKSWEKQSKPDYPLVVLITASRNETAKTLGEKSNPPIELSQVFGSGYLPPNRAVSEPLWAALGKYLENGNVVPNKAQVVRGGLRGLEEALELNKKGVSGVKVVVNPDQTQS